MRAISSVAAALARPPGGQTDQYRADLEQLLDFILRQQSDPRAALGRHYDQSAFLDETERFARRGATTGIPRPSAVASGALRAQGSD